MPFKISSWFLVGSSPTKQNHEVSVNNEPTTVYRKSNGFTLIELLIIIAVLAILVSIFSASYFHFVKSSRDARRKSDLENVRLALEQAKVDCGGNYYPAKGTGTTTAGTATNYFVALGPHLVALKYMRSVPQDPISGGSYRSKTSNDTPGIGVCPDSTGGMTTTGSINFVVWTFLEATDDPASIESQTKCPANIYVAGVTGYTTWPANTYAVCN